jgi:hypothetical protein
LRILKLVLGPVRRKKKSLGIFCDSNHLARLSLGSTVRDPAPHLIALSL